MNVSVIADIAEAMSEGNILLYFVAFFPLFKASTFVRKSGKGSSSSSVLPGCLLLLCACSTNELIIMIKLIFYVATAPLIKNLKCLLLHHMFVIGNDSFVSKNNVK